MEYWTAFILGLVGSVHCAGMCGPLVLALPAPDRRVRFLAGRAAYNGGRIITYSFLGALFGAVGQSLVMIGVQRWFSIALGTTLLLSLLLGRSAAVSKTGRSTWSRLNLLRPVTVAVDLLKSKMGALLRQRSLLSLLVLGLLNGLLPCGLVYVACAAAAATNRFSTGLVYMALFGLGTVPMLLAITFSGRLVPPSWRMHLRKAVPVSIFIVAAMLIFRGMGLGIPYLSPDLTGAAHSCCVAK
ncbi:MAG TPA: sulfite exporter TauE/SafE family protein [Terriglobales bacterium]|nr:sulfite exporter TauE/SafE family protein [Terriglobales bacterium]